MPSYFTRFNTWGNGWINYFFSGKNKWVSYAFIMLAMMLLVFILVGRVATHSKPYSRASFFIVHSKCIRQHLGYIHKIKMGLLSKFYTKDNTALFNLNVEGQKAAGKVKVTLIRNQEWRVSEAILNSKGERWDCSSVNTNN